MAKDLCLASIPDSNGTVPDIGWEDVTVTGFAAEKLGIPREHVPGLSVGWNHKANLKKTLVMHNAKHDTKELTKEYQKAQELNS